VGGAEAYDHKNAWSSTKSFNPLWLSPRAISGGVDSSHPFRGYSNEDAATKTRSSVASQTEKLQKGKPKQHENVYLRI
jgi:hypothetical protein